MLEGSCDLKMETILQIQAVVSQSSVIPDLSNPTHMFPSSMDPKKSDSAENCLLVSNDDKRGKMKL